jgi:exonuclease SbcC
MRILQLRFKNLNSLVGEWLIDLSHPEYVADGIFAITGPTGAGKSTILDAICLALYGRTPRLRNISKSSNEIMSRQTGECFAELIFETNAGKYRCHWSQHRARKKAEGELQSPKHEIADVLSGKIIESKIRGVADKIEKATGMDFDRFTRSMLLAQGGFAAFLQADADQRAPILEQITGTEIYSHISMKTHERRVVETKKLDLLSAELAGMQLLSAEEEQQLTENLTGKTQADTVLNQVLIQKNMAITWLEGIANAEADLAKLNEQQQDLTNRQQLFQPQLYKLEQAKQALELSADYAGLTAMRNEQQHRQQELTISQQALPEMDLQHTQATQNLNTATSTLELEKTEQKHTQIIINKVRELDFKIQEKQRPIQSVEDKISLDKQQLNSLRGQQNQDIYERDKNQIKLTGVMTLLNNHQVDEGLIEQLANIEHKFHLLGDYADKQQQKKNDLANAEHNNKETARRWQLQSNVLQQHQKEFERIQSNVTELQDELVKKLAKRSLKEWRLEQVRLTKRQENLEKSQASLYMLVSLRDEWKQLTNQEMTLNSEVKEFNQQTTEQNTCNQSLEREIQLLETQHQLQKKIESYEDARQHLHDDQPCPLCGADEHPYALGNVPVLDDTEKSLNAVKTELKLNTESLAQLGIKRAENQKDLIHNKKQQLETASNITKEQNLLTQYSSLLAIDGEVADTELSQLRNDNETQLIQLTSIVFDAENIEQQLVSEREAQDKKRAELTEVDKSLQAINHNKLVAEQAAERVAKELTTSTTQLSDAQQATLEDVIVYGVKSLATESLADTFNNLSERRDKWREWQQDKAKLEPLISNLINQIKHRTDRLISVESELKIQQQTMIQLNSELKVFKQERVTLFAYKNPDSLESDLINKVEQAEISLEMARQLSQKTGQTLNKLQHDIETLTSGIKSRSEQLKLLERGFNQRLFKAGFSDEKAYKAACLNDGQREVLQQQDQLLRGELTVLMARLQDKTTFLVTERAKQITEQPLDLLKMEQEPLATKLNILKQEIGAISQKLKDNNDIRLKQQSRVEQIDGQKRECVRWNTLHELIGSADGKKYRNFAQGLTFEMMIGHANRQLQKMTDRYLLIRDEAQPLELNVVDNYQAGETRSTKNLSGGESFIVSLSLALGLSQMASKNVRVDSLFLDEGFGTLDEEALDTALETLASLQQEGKLIGVISHVQVLKERISTQIQINPSSGGRSTISGPGISQASL